MSDLEKILSRFLSFFENFDFGHPDGIRSILKFAIELLQVQVAQFGYFDHESKVPRIRAQYRCPHGSIVLLLRYLVLLKDEEQGKGVLRGETTQEYLAIGRFIIFECK